jgi:putative aminopeptidase FrvX
MNASDFDFDFDYDLLKRLTEARGVPGYEDRVRALVRDELESHVDAIENDGMGNVVATIEGSTNPDFEVVVAAHMDEIGFIVRHVTDEGFLQLDALGGWDPQVLRAQRVTVHTREGDVPGLIGSVPPHTLDDDHDPSKHKVENVHVDLGLHGEDASDSPVEVGDLVTMDQHTEVVGEHVTGKSLDNRVSVFALIEAARRMEEPAVTVHLAATVQEEVGLRGATALGVDIDADLALALDTTVANDVPGFSPGDHVTTLGEGAAIKLKDSSVITNPKVHRRLRDVAEEGDIPFQLEILPAGGTDTGGLQKSGGATAAGAISFPTRYLHTVTESVHHADVAAAIDLLVAFLESEDGGHDYSL